MEIKKKYLIVGIILILLIGVLIGFLFSCKNQDFSFTHSTKKVANSIVVIKVQTPDGEIPICTGFIVDKRGYILTAKHCYEGIASAINKDPNVNVSSDDVALNIGIIEIEKNSLKETYKIEPIKNLELERKDIQLLKISENTELVPIVIAKKEEISFGMEVGFLGYTNIEQNLNNYPLFISKGVLSNSEINLRGQTEPFYTINALATNGFSGGPVFLSKNGHVFGIISSGTNDETGKTGIVFVPPIHEISKIIEELES
jgi:S1-C subfamily serine protease